LIPIQEDLDEPALQEIAHMTGGRYYRATSAKEMEDIYAQIDQLEKTEINGPALQEYQDHYWGWLVLAMALLTFGFGLEATVLRKFP